ncbi:MAG: hypothetical protein LBR51_03015 [Bacteroidales bacterium]|jgi:hypothetical protein|nr:hypothetical protein [Bacteroidales bacterium]
MKKVLFLVGMIATGIHLHAQKGYTGMIETGYSICVGTVFDKREMTLINPPFGDNCFNFKTVHGYSVNSFFFIGGGVGYTYGNTPATLYDDEVLKKAAHILPVFLRIEANVLDTKISPFFVLDGGYSFQLNGDMYHHTLWFVSPSIGINFKINDLKLYCSFGLPFQQVQYYKLTPYFWYEDSSGNIQWFYKEDGRPKIWLRSIEFKWGVQF